MLLFRFFRSVILALATAMAGAMPALSANVEAPAVAPAQAERFRQIAAELQAAREQISRKIAQPLELSRVLAEALAACDTALQRKDAVAARRALAPLEAYAPLLSFPSLQLQFLAGRVSALEIRPDLAEEHAARAAVLLKRYHEARGLSEDAPVEFWNQFEIREWADALSLRSQGIRTLTGSSELRGEFLDQDGQQQVRYLLLRQRAVQPFDAMDDASLNGEQRQAIADARKARDEFLGSKVPYLRLRQAISTATKEADQLLAARQFAQGLTRLEQLGDIYPLDQIPSIHLLSRVSFAAGMTGNLQRQQALRLRMFGLQQLMARDGDGASAATAIEVAFVSDEYFWLQAHGLKLTMQHLVPGADVGRPGKSFDALDVEGPQGKRTVYFDVTRLFGLYIVRDPQ